MVQSQRSELYGAIEVRPLVVELDFQRPVQVPVETERECARGPGGDGGVREARAEQVAVGVDPGVPRGHLEGAPLPLARVELALRSGVAVGRLLSREDVGRLDEPA